MKKEKRAYSKLWIHPKLYLDLKWTGKRKDWGKIHAQLEIFFEDRMPL